MKELVPGVRGVDAPGELGDVPAGDPDEQSASSDGRRDVD
jgi:hypothetical protein